MKLKSTYGILFSLILFLLLSSVVQAQAKQKKQQYAQVNGTTLAYEIAGKGRNVVFIHGGLSDSRVWDDQFYKLAKQFRVIRYDLRGFNRSAFPTAAFSHVEDLYSLLKFLKIEKTSLAGLSLGGIIAAEFALEHPEMSERIVFTSSGLRGDRTPRNPLSAIIYQTAEKYGLEPALAMWKTHPFFASGMSHWKYSKRMRQMLSDNYKYWGPTPQIIQVVWSKTPTIERLDQIKTPSIIIVGDKDAPEILATADILKSKIANAEKIIISGVSHHLVMEKSAEYNRFVIKFLKGK